MLRAARQLTRTIRHVVDGLTMSRPRAEEPLPGCRELHPPLLSDARGSFVKVLRAGLLDELEDDFSVAEIFWTVSQRNVVRGLHFQTPPHAVSKLVWCTRGTAYDVLLDLREGSPTFGGCQSFLLSASVGNCVFVPVGVAHGFCSLENETTISYAQSGSFSAPHDLGVHWTSANVDWPVGTQSAILSDRDLQHPALADFSSPFRFDR